jgi:hypothetical protein
LNIEEQIPESKAKLQVRKKSLEELQEDLKALNAKVKHEEIATMAMRSMLDKDIALKKRLWDAMSKEEIREVGVRGAERKRKRQKKDE